MRFMLVVMIVALVACKSDRVVVQLSTDGSPARCWCLKRVYILDAREPDAIGWIDPQTGDEVWIAGPYNVAGARGSDLESAARNLGVDLSKCDGGAYHR